MADKTPIKAILDGTDVIALGEFITGDTVPITNGGTGATTNTAARSNLGLGDSATKNVGTTTGTVAAGDHIHSGVYQPADAELTAIAGLTSAADKVPYFTGSGTAAVATLTATGRNLIDDATTADQRTTLELGTSNSPQFAGINLGHASDTTFSRVSAGVAAIEGDTIATASSTLTLTNKTISNPTISNGYKEEIGTSVPSKINPDNGSIQIFTLTDNLDWTGDDELEDGESILLMVADGSSTYTITWPTITWVGGTAPILDTTKYTCIELWKVSSTLYGALVGFA